MREVVGSKNSAPPKKAYGLYINIDYNFELMLKDIGNSGAEHKAEIAVSYYGRVREYSLEEFLTRLGIRGKT